MERLNFPEYAFDIREGEQKKLIFDIVRKKLIPLTPEEWVRQHVLQFLKHQYEISESLIAVERELKFNTLKKRFDVLVFNSSGSPECIVECKAPNIKIDQKTLIQVAMYNRTYNCPWLWLTNGMEHYWIYIDAGKVQAVPTPECWPFTKP